MHREDVMFRMVIVVVAMLAVPAQAELYKWTDAEGRVHFTDKKPDKANKVETLQAPRVTGPGGRQAESAPAAENSGDVLQRQKRMADILTQEREQQEQASVRKRNEDALRKRKCMEMQDYRRNVDGARLYDIDEKGERVFMDDARHTQHMRELDQAIRANCQ